MNWSLLFFIYVLFSFLITSFASVNMKGNDKVGNVAYLNSILLVISAFLLGGLGALLFFEKTDASAKILAGLVIVASLASTIISSLMIGDAQFSNCTPIVKNSIVACLTVNISVVFAAIVFAAVYRDAWLPEFGNKDKKIQVNDPNYIQNWIRDWDKKKRRVSP